MPSFPVFVLGFAVCFLSPYPDSLPQLFLRCFPLALAFGLFRFLSGSFRPLTFRLRLLGLCFFLSALLRFASQWLLRCSAPAHASSVFPVLPSPVSRAFVSGSRTRLPVRFLSSFPVSLPQPFHRCFPYAFAFGLSPRSNFLSSVLRSVLTTQPSALSFPFFPFSPGGGSHGASFLFRPACCHAVLPIPVLSFLQFLSPSAVSLHRSYHSAPTLAVDFPWLTL